MATWTRREVTPQFIVSETTDKRGRTCRLENRELGPYGDEALYRNVHMSRPRMTDPNGPGEYLMAFCEGDQIVTGWLCIRKNSRDEAEQHIETDYLNR